MFSTYLGLATLFGYNITPFLNEVKKVDIHACYQAYQISCMTCKTRGYYGLPKFFELQGILKGIERFHVSQRLKKSKFPYFSFTEGVLTITGSNSRKAFLSSLNSITKLGCSDKVLSSYKPGSVQDTLLKLIRCYLFRWAKRRSSFLIRELILSLNRGILPLFKFLNKWKLGFTKNYQKPNLIGSGRILKEETWKQTKDLFVHKFLPEFSMGLALFRSTSKLGYGTLLKHYLVQKFDTKFVAGDICLKLN